MNSEIPLIQAWIERKQAHQSALRLIVKDGHCPKILETYLSNAVLICQAEKMIVENINT